MFPIRDHNPSGRTPYVTYALIVANVLIFISYMGLLGDDQAVREILADYAVIPASITYGEGYGTLISSMFLHAGFMHIAGNMLFLWIFGDNLEDEMGHVGFLLFYLACGIGAGLIHVASAPQSMVPTVGASGAIAGVLGGYLLLFPRARVDVLVIFIIFFRIFSLPAFVMLGLWFGLQLLGGVGSTADSGGVAYWAHIGGFVLGIVLTLPLFLKRGGTRYWSRTDGHPPHPQADYGAVRSNIPRVPRR